MPPPTMAKLAQTATGVRVKLSGLGDSYESLFFAKKTSLSSEKSCTPHEP